MVDRFPVRCFFPLVIFPQMGFDAVKGCLDSKTVLLISQALPNEEDNVLHDQQVVSLYM